MFPGLLIASLLSTTPPAALVTRAEASGFKTTGRYDEVQRLCAEFERRYPERVRCLTFGVTPEQRPMLALVASADGTLTPDAARAQKRPVVLAQGGIHAGEIDGKDAGFWLLRQLLDGEVAPDVLKQVTFVFVPVFNVDGHERFGKNQRPNQRGPEETGWRVTSSNLNVNRDYVKADTPEMQAMLRLLGTWDPILYLDLHVTDGSKFEHDVAIMLEPQHADSELLRPHGVKARRDVFAALEKWGHLPLSFYPSLVDENDPSSGFHFGIAPPRFSQAYWAARNRFGVLVEAHSWKDYPTRVKTTRDVVLAFLEVAARDGAQWLEAASRADAEDRASARSAAKRDVVLRWKNTAKTTTLDFRGYAYTRELSDVSGKHWVRYDETKPQIWRVPFKGEVEPSITVRAPSRGYVVHAGFAEVVARRLQLHGFQYDVLDEGRTQQVDAFRISKVTLSPTSFEGRQLATLEGEWRKEQVSIPAGSLFVPIAQRGRSLLVHLLDPQGPDSLGAWGSFNSVTEQKEYIEDYLVEEFAREAMKRDPKLRAEFEEKLKADPEFARNPSARLRFFAVRHPAWDARLNQYPVFRVD